ncbi:MAG: ABC transporter permease [Asticcacaulis sp.]|uniref:ABC transporter permease n=1 Tax=Asticcacaulis sp. TaxID=1872648 RepID=UPI0039E46624
MVKSALLAFFRSFRRHPLYALLNILGLSFGIAVFITLSLLYRFETSYESWSPERQHIYAMGVRLHTPGIPDDLVMETMGGLLEEIQSAYPQIEGTRDMPDTAIVQRGADVFSENLKLVDQNFLTFFRVPVLRGNASGALTAPSSIVLSASCARKYFGTIDIIGQGLTLTDLEGKKTYTVSAVIADLPRNSDMQINMLRRLTPQRAALGGLWHQWGVIATSTYLKFKNPADEAAFAAQIPAFTDRQAGTTFHDVVPHKVLELALVPLADRHLINPKLRTAIMSLGVVGILTLALALINYVNLATARAGLRAREVAVRKTLGASPAALRLQFLMEAIPTLVLSFLIALSVVELSLPLINAVGSLSLMLDYRADGQWLLSLFGGVLLAGLMAALYPALMLSAFKPAQVLAASRMPGGGRAAGGVRTGLAMLQFTIVVVAFVLMAGFILQIRHMQTADLGFRRDHLMIVNALRNPTVTPAQREAFITASRKLPGVRDVAAGNAMPGPGGGLGGFSKIFRPGQNNEALAPNLKIAIVGPDYFQMLGTRLLAGRFFDPQHGEDQLRDVPDGAAKGHVTSVIISRQAVAAMGFASPQTAVNQMANLGNDSDGLVRIVGVVDDMRFESPNEALPPRLYMFDTGLEGAIAMIRYQGVTETDMRHLLKNLWQSIIPDVPFDAISAESSLDGYYKPERDRSHLFNIGVGMAAVIGCIGLYGMAAFNTGRRVHEIGMRKVLGASRRQIVRLLLVQFLRPVAIASLIAWPLAWIILQRWLSQFDDVIAMPLWVFPLASVAALLIALVTVTWVAFTAASTEPGKALRQD